MFNRLQRILKAYLFAPAGQFDVLRDPGEEQRELELKNEVQPIRLSLEERNRVAVAHRLISSLERHGLTLEGTPGEETTFDPDRHAPLARDAPLAPGTPVVIKVAGASNTVIAVWD